MVVSLSLSLRVLNSVFTAKLMGIQIFRYLMAYHEKHLLYSEANRSACASALSDQLLWGSKSSSFFRSGGCNYKFVIIISSFIDTCTWP